MKEEEESKETTSDGSRLAKTRICSVYLFYELASTVPPHLIILLQTQFLCNPSLTFLGGLTASDRCGGAGEPVGGTVACPKSGRTSQQSRSNKCRQIQAIALAYGEA
jgi:hypothetical protein